MSSTHLFQIFNLHKIQSLKVHCKPNDMFLYNTDSEIEWWKIDYKKKSNKRNPSAESLKVIQRTRKPFNNAYKPILSNITSTESSHLMCTENEGIGFYRKMKWLKAISSVSSNKRNIPTKANPPRLYQIMVH